MTNAVASACASFRCPRAIGAENDSVPARSNFKNDGPKTICDGDGFLCGKAVFFVFIRVKSWLLSPAHRYPCRARFMSRFANLEFNADSEGAPRRQDSARDEELCLAQAQAAFESADFEGALRSFAKALEFNPQSAVAWGGQVRALIELGEFSEAKLWADKALERFPEDPELLAAKAVALARLGDTDAAITFSDAAVEARGDTPYVWLARGDVLLARAEKRADYCFDKALGLAAGDWFVTWLAARIRGFYRQFTLALKLVQQALAWKPDHGMLWLMAGQCQRELGLVAAAKGSFEQALQLDPHHHQARHAMTALDNRGLGARLSGWWRRMNSK